MSFFVFWYRNKFNEEMPFKIVFIVTKKEFQPPSLKYPNCRGANWSFQVSACLSSWTWTTVESQHFGVCLWWVLTIKYNWWQYDTIQNQKRNFFFGNNESNTQDGENVARRIQRQFFKKQRWATVYCPQVFISGHEGVFHLPYKLYLLVCLKFYAGL